MSTWGLGDKLEEEVYGPRVKSVRPVRGQLCRLDFFFQVDTIWVT